MSDKIKKWQELSKELVFQKFSRGIEKVKYLLPDGNEMDFYLKKEGPAVAILALTKDQQIILVKQFRPGPGEILNELPGGFVGENEEPSQAAERELLEETGYKGKLQFVTTFFDCAYSTMKRHCFVATECGKISEQNLDQTEFAELVLMSLNEFRQNLKDGKNTDVEAGYIGLDFLNLL
jgi:ADP-ribose diphosphatase